MWQHKKYNMQSRVLESFEFAPLVLVNLHLLCLLVYGGKLNLQESTEKHKWQLLLYLIIQYKYTNASHRVMIMNIPSAFLPKC